MYTMQNEKHKSMFEIWVIHVCEIYVNESNFCDIYKNNSNFLSIDYFANLIPACHISARIYPILAALWQCVEPGYNSRDHEIPAYISTDIIKNHI